MIEAGAAVDGHERDLARRTDRYMIDDLAARIRRGRFVRGSRPGRGEAKAKRDDEMVRLAEGHGISLRKIGRSND